MKWLLCVAVAFAATEIEVFRLIQYEHEGTLLGSQVASLNFLGAHYLNTKEIPRKMTLIHINELSLSTLSFVLSNKPSALLIIIDKSSPPDNLHELETHLGSSTYQFPIYFAYQTPSIISVYEELKEIPSDQSFNSDQLSFELKTNEKTPLRPLKLENLYGFVYEYSEQLPTVALVAYYDSFSVVPEMTKGMDRNGSGVIAILELAKIFHKLFAQSPPAFNLMLLLNSAGNLNFQGIKSWLDAEDPEIQSIAQNIVFALCLDTIGKDQEVNLHISRFHKPEETEVKRLYDSMNKTASLAKTQLNYVKKKVNMADPYIPWQHENFARKKIVGATFSHLPSPFSSNLDSSNILDDTFDSEALERNVRFLAESLSRFLYNLEDNKLILYDKQDLTSQESIETFKQQLANFTRFPTQLGVNSAFTKLLKQSLKESVGMNLTSQEFQLSEFTFYDSKVETLKVYKVKPPILDFYVFLGTLSYIAVLWALLKFCGNLRFAKQKKK